MRNKHVKELQNSIVSRVVVVLALTLSGAFAAGVVWYQGPDSWLVRSMLIVAWLAFGAACGAWFVRGASVRALTAYALAFAAIVLWLVLIAPRNDRIWSPEMARTLTYARDGDALIVSNVRNFSWAGPTDAVERWETRRYDLNALKTVDVLSLYWKGPRIAHTYFSFVWASGEALSISVEIRKEKGEEYSPVGGFFNAYEIAILGGDERDFYGWRIHFPAEDIQLFRTRAKPDEAVELLIALLDMANSLAKTPAFYNTLTNNCTTEAWLMTDALGAGRPFDWRTLASGYLPDMLYEIEILDTSRPLEELRERGHILPSARIALDRRLTGPAFSIAIRQAVPGFAAASR